MWIPHAQLAHKTQRTPTSETPQQQEQNKPRGAGIFKERQRIGIRVTRGEQLFLVYSRNANSLFLAAVFFTRSVLIVGAESRRLRESFWCFTQWMDS